MLIKPSFQKLPTYQRVLILFAGILYMMSGTDPGKANVAKDIIFTALTGLALIFLVKIIFYWILS